MTPPQTAEAANESDAVQPLSKPTGVSLAMVAIAIALACVWVLLSAGPAQ